MAIRDVFRRAKRVIKQEIIGRVASQTSNLWSTFAFKTLDETRPDYKFWDKFFRGFAPGFKFAHLLAKPIVSITVAWVMGDGIGIRTEDTYTNEKLNDMMDANQGFFREVLEDKYRLGDQYVICNPDGTFSSVSPETMKLERDPLDYRKIVKATITSNLNNLIVIDEYTPEKRTVTIENISSKPVTLSDGTVLLPKVKVPFEYDNLIGMVPVVHFATDKSGNELFGRPIYEALYTLFDKYDDLLVKMVTGAELLGNPIPVFEGILDIDNAIDDAKSPTTERYDLLGENGSSEITREEILFDREAMITTTPGVRFKFEGPNPAFPNSVKIVLKTLFILVMEYTGIPEVVWGNELSSSRASAEEQMKTFYAYIWGRRLEFAGSPGRHDGLLTLFDIWLRYMALTDNKIKVLPTTIEWPALASEDAKLTFEKATAAYDRAAIDRAMLLRLYDILDEVSEDEAVVKADAERGSDEIEDDQMTDAHESDLEESEAMEAAA